MGDLVGIPTLPQSERKAVAHYSASVRKMMLIHVVREWFGGA